MFCYILGGDISQPNPSLMSMLAAHAPRASSPWALRLWPQRAPPQVMMTLWTCADQEKRTPMQRGNTFQSLSAPPALVIGYDCELLFAGRIFVCNPAMRMQAMLTDRFFASSSRHACYHVVSPCQPVQVLRMPRRGAWLDNSPLVCLLSHRWRRADNQQSVRPAVC